MLLPSMHYCTCSNSAVWTVSPVMSSILWLTLVMTGSSSSSNQALRHKTYIHINKHIVEYTDRHMLILVEFKFVHVFPSGSLMSVLGDFKMLTADVADKNATR